MNRFREEDDQMTAEDWKAMYLLLFHAQAEVIEQVLTLPRMEILRILGEAAQKAEEHYISRGIRQRNGRKRSE